VFVRPFGRRPSVLVWACPPHTNYWGGARAAPTNTPTLRAHLVVALVLLISSPLVGERGWTRAKGGARP
jgi:hypothetical protein